MKTLDSYFDEDGQKGKRDPEPEAAPGTDTLDNCTSPAVATKGWSEGVVITGGLVVNAVEMMDFMRYLDRQTVSFDEKFTVITGRTGAGKSSILDAITFAIYGETTRTRYVKQEDVCRPGGYVKVSFLLGDDSYVVTRGINQQGGGAYLAVEINDSILPGKTRELESQLMDLIGLDYQAFCNSTFIRQDEMRELGASRPAERLKIFQKLFRLDVFERAQKVCKERLEGVQGEKKKLDGKLEEIDKTLGTRDELEGERDEIQKQVNSLQAKKPGLKKRVDELEGRSRELEAACQRGKPALEELGRNRKELEEVKFKLEETRGNATRLVKVGKEIDELSSGKTPDGLQLREKELQLKEKSYGLLNGQLTEFVKSKQKLESQHAGKMREWESRLDNERDRLKNISTEISHDEAFKLLRCEGGLEERLSRILLELDWLAENDELVGRLNRERGETGNELDGVKNTTAAINADCFVVTEIRRNVEELKDYRKREKESHDGNCRELDESIKKVKSEIGGVGFDDNDKRELGEVKKQLTDARAREEKLVNLRKLKDDLAGAPELVTEYSAMEKRISAQLAEKEGKVGKLKELATKLEKAKKELDAAGVEYDKLREEELRLLERLNGKIQQLERLDGEKKRRDGYTEEHGKLSRREEVLSTLANRIFHNRGLALFALRQLLDPLSAEASQFLADITENRFSKLRLVSKQDDKRSFGISVEVEGVDGKFHDVAEFSGGERTQINAALRLSIASELARMPQAGRNYCRMRTLIIDEGDLGSLDSDISRNLFVQKLFKLEDLFDRVVLITHLSEVSDLFPAQLNVEMDALGRSRVDVVR